MEEPVWEVTLERYAVQMNRLITGSLPFSGGPMISNIGAAGSACLVKGIVAFITKFRVIPICVSSLPSEEQEWQNRRRHLVGC